MNNLGRNIVLWICVALCLAVLFDVFQPSSSQTDTTQIAYSSFMEQVKNHQVQDVTLSGHNITGTTKDNKTFETYAPADQHLANQLTDQGINVVAKPQETHSLLFQILINVAPIILIAAVWIFFMRQMQSGGGRAMGFGKSKARLLSDKQGRVTFDDVAGIDEAKGELQEIVDFLRDPQKFQRLGGKIPKGCLLVGPPGTGKTLLARAIAGEANVPFFSISGSDFVEMFVGVGASRVRDMFEQGKKNAPCIIFIDEIDAVGRHRGAGMGGGNDEREQTLNQMLVEMDGFESSEGVILIAATNRPDVLDQALLRPGRFDRQVVVSNPDVGGREKILKVHMRKVPLASDVDAKIIARGTPGFSGADLANLVNEAALYAARIGKRVVAMAEFEYAKDKVMMGAERRSMVMSDEEKRMTAYHEGGHALCSITLPECDPVHKATIIPRGRALGMVMSLPDGDKYSMSKIKLLQQLVMAMGGRAAEELVFGPDKVSNGASGDIKAATDITRRMVTEWGMSEKLGMVSYADSGQEAMFGYGGGGKSVSEATAREIDDEVRRFIDHAYGEAKRILTERREDLERLAQGLLEYETLSGDEIEQVLRGEKIMRKVVDEPAPDNNNRRGSVPSASQPGIQGGMGPALPA